MAGQDVSHAPVVTSACRILLRDARISRGAEAHGVIPTISYSAEFESSLPREVVHDPKVPYYLSIVGANACLIECRNRPRQISETLGLSLRNLGAWQSQHSHAAKYALCKCLMAGGEEHFTWIAQKVSGELSLAES